MPTIINGQRGAFLQPPRYGIDSSGPYTVYTYEGTVPELKALVPSLELFGGLWEIQESFTGAKSQLTVRLPVNATNTNNAETPVDEWEVFSATVEKDMLEADNPIINGLSITDIRAIRKSLKDPPDNGIEPTWGATADSDDAIPIYNFMMRGFKHIRVDIPGLRHTATVSRAYQIPQSLSNVRRIFRSSTLIAQEPTLPSSISSNMIDETWAGNATFPTEEYMYGWFKKFPTIRLAARQKSQIVQEWEYGLWPKVPAIYGAIL